MIPFEPHKTREQYLERLLARYGTISLPLDSVARAFPLQTVFQPMVLRRDPLAPRDTQPGTVQEVVRAGDGTEALAKSAHGRMVILGGPGMGKTTALKMLLATAIRVARADPSAPLPLFLSLPDLARSERSFEAYIPHLLAELEIDPRFADILTGAINAGRAFLCLDSLDEVLPPLRPDVIALLNQEASRCRGVWIIGSRFTEYKGGQFASSQFAEWELQALGEQERLSLAHHLLPALYDALSSHVAEDLKPAFPTGKAYVEELQRNTQIASWGENPLLFSLAAIPYVQTGRLPASRAVLYAQAVEAMLAMRIPDAGQRAALRHVLSELALTFYQTRGRNFSTTDVLEFLPTLFPEQPVSFLYDMLARLLDSGVLEPAAYQIYGFKHQMFQEYLAASALAQRCVDSTQRQHAWNLLWRKRRLGRWNEILRLLVGILVQECGAEGLQVAREWLSALAGEYHSSEGDPGNLCLILALQSLGELGEHVSNPHVTELAKDILSLWEERLLELLNLGKWQHYRPVLKQASILPAFSLQMAVPIILNLQQRYPRTYLYDIPETSGVIGKPIPARILWYVFEDKSLSLYTCHTVRALQDSTVIERLLAILENTDGTWRVEDRETVIELLGRLQEKTPIQLLARIWQDKTLEDGLRQTAAQVLGEFDPSVPLDVFVAMCNDTHPSLRGVALAVLSKRSAHTHLHLIVSALQDEGCPWRELALSSLREQNIPLPLELLQDLLYDKHEQVSEEAWNYLRAMGKQVPLELWLDALQHEHEWVREYALTMVEQEKDQIPVEPVLAMLAHGKKDAYKSVDVRTHCIKALGLLGERVPLEPLLALLEHSDEHLRASALSVLTRRHVTLPAQILLPMLDHSITEGAAVQALASLGAAAPIPALLELARTHASNSASPAIRALCLLVPYVPTEPILKLLRDEEIRDSYMEAYWELIQLLQVQGVEVSFEELLPALKRSSWSEERFLPIVAALQRAGAQAPIEPLLEMTYEAMCEGGTLTPKWIPLLFSVLYEWVSPQNLINALSNTAADQWLAVSLLGCVHDEESIQLLTTVAQDPARDHATRSEAMVILSDLGINVPLEYLIQATWWCTYEGMGYYLADTVERLGEQAPLEQLLPLLGVDHNRLQPGVVEALTRIAQAIPLEMILPLLDDTNELVRRAAISILGGMGEKAPLDVLDALRSDFGQTLETRCAVLSALGKLDTPAAMDLLLRALTDSSREIRRWALYELQIDESEDAKQGLRVLPEQRREILLELLLKLLDDPNEEVAEKAIGVLGDLAKVGVAIPVEPLIAFLDHENESFIEAAAEALCKCGERTPIQVLIEHMQNTTDEEIRGRIFYALSEIEACIPWDDVLAVLSELTNEQPEWWTGFALSTLARSKPEEVLKLFHHDSRPAIRLVVLQAIAQTAECEWLPLIRETLQDAAGRYAAYDQQQYHSDEKVRAAAIRALGALAACAPVEELFPFLYTNAEEHDYNDERIVVLKALKGTGSRVPFSALLPLLGSNHRTISRLAFQHIQEAYPDALRELVPALKTMVRGEPVQGVFAPRMHHRIAETVAAMGRATPPVLEMVIALLDHPFWELRVNAAQTLGILRRNIPDRAIRRLLELRRDPESPDVRAAADLALAEILSLEQGMEDD